MGGKLIRIGWISGAKSCGGVGPSTVTKFAGILRAEYLSNGEWNEITPVEPLISVMDPPEDVMDGVVESVPPYPPKYSDPPVATRVAPDTSPAPITS